MRNPILLSRIHLRVRLVSLLVLRDENGVPAEEPLATWMLSHKALRHPLKDVLAALRINEDHRADCACRSAGETVEHSAEAVGADGVEEPFDVGTGHFTHGVEAEGGVFDDD